MCVCMSFCMCGFRSLEDPTVSAAKARGHCYWIGRMDPRLDASPVETSCLGGEGSFPFCIRTANDETVLRLKQDTLYSVAREWRSGNLVHRAASLARGWIRQDFKTKLTEEECYILVFWEKAGFLQELGCHLFSALVGSFGIWVLWHLRQKQVEPSRHSRAEILLL